MIGQYTSDVNEHGLILKVQNNDDTAPQTLYLTRSEWAMVKRTIDAQFYKVKRVRGTT